MVRAMFIDAKFEGEIKITKHLKDYLEKHKPSSIALFASVQFQELENFIEGLKKLNIEVKTTKAKRTDKPIQILGCNCYEESFEKNIIKDADLILYIGDGMFHPKALLLAQIKSFVIKPIIIFNPISDHIAEINKDNIEEQLLRMKRNLRLFISAEKIGVIITTKLGQQYIGAAEKLKESLESKGKRVYLFLADNIGFDDFKNFNFIEAWVNTACPRIATDDIIHIKEPIINLKEANDPIKALEELS